MPGLVKLLRGDDPFGRDNLAINSAHAHFDSLVIAPQVAVLASHSQIDLAHRHGPARRPEQPFPDQFGLGPCIENEPAWSVENASQHELSVTALSYLQISHVLHR